MKTLLSTEALDQLKRTHLFLDTNILIDSTLNRAVLKLLQEIKGVECSLVTIPSVVFEFVRGAGSVETYVEQQRLLNDLFDTIYPIEKHLGEFHEFALVMNRCAPKDRRRTLSYTDYLLCAALFKFDNVFLMTADKKDIPLAIFERSFVAVADDNEHLNTYGIYRLSKTSYEKAKTNITKI